MKKYFFCCLTISCLIFEDSAFAYLDPSMTTNIIQIIVGVVVAGGAVIGFHFRKAKKKLQEKLGLDENTGKEVEEDIEFSDEKERKKNNMRSDSHPDG